MPCVVQHLSRAGVAWCVLCVSALSILTPPTSSASSFYRVGPGPEFVAFGVAIDTVPRYAALLLYCMLNSVARTLHSEVVQPWIVTRVQQQQPHQQSAEDRAFVLRHAHEVVTASVIYTWFDWFFSINVLFSQLDVVLVEVSCNVLTAAWTTRNYLNTSM